MPPFAEDQAVCRVAEETGLTLSRYESIEISDEAAIAAAGLVIQKPDYRRIRKLLADGGEVPGAKLRGVVEYRLKPRPIPN